MSASSTNPPRCLVAACLIVHRCPNSASLSILDSSRGASNVCFFDGAECVLDRLGSFESMQDDAPLRLRLSCGPRSSPRDSNYLIHDRDQSPVSLSIEADFLCSAMMWLSFHDSVSHISNVAAKDFYSGQVHRCIARSFPLLKTQIYSREVFRAATSLSAALSTHLRPFHLCPINPLFRVNSRLCHLEPEPSRNERKMLLDTPKREGSVVTAFKLSPRKIVY